VTMSFPESWDAFREWLQENSRRLMSQEDVLALPLDLADRALDYLHFNNGLFVPSVVVGEETGREEIFSSEFLRMISGEFNDSVQVGSDAEGLVPMPVARAVPEEDLSSVENWEEDVSPSALLSMPLDVDDFDLYLNGRVGASNLGRHLGHFSDTEIVPSSVTPESSIVFPVTVSVQEVALRSLTGYVAPPLSPGFYFIVPVGAAVSARLSTSVDVNWAAPMSLAGPVGVLGARGDASSTPLQDLG
jgi:hypothetical protein